MPTEWMGWTGHVYPDKADLLVAVPIGLHQTLTKCRSTAQRLILAKGWANADYECGLNCSPLFPSLPDSVLSCVRSER